MRLARQTPIRTKLAIAMALLGTVWLMPALSRENHEDSLPGVVFRLSIPRFHKLDGPERLDALETLLPQVLKAGLFRYGWLEVSAGESAPSDPSVPATNAAGNTKIVSTFVLEGTFVAFEDKIRLDFALRNTLDNSVELRGFEVFGEDTILDLADRLDKRVADTLQTKVALRAVERHIPFGIASAFQNKGGEAPYASLGSFLSSEMLSQLSIAKLPDITFRRVDTQERERGPAEPEAMVSGEYDVSGNEVRAMARIQERRGAEFLVEASGSLDQVPELARALSKRVLEIIRGRITPEGKWRPESISLSNAKPEEYLAEARKYEQSKEFFPAVVMYRKALEKKPDYIEARSRLADLYMREGDYDGAISEYQNILRQESQEVTALFGLGAAYLRAGNYRDAIPQIEKAQQLGLNGPQMQARLYRTLGDAYLLAGRHEDAIQQYLRGLKTSGDSPDFYHALARAYRAHEELPQAIETLNKARSLYPDDQEFTVDLASVFVAQGRHYYDDQKWEQALETYQKALDLHSNDRQVQAEAYGYSGAIIGHFLTPLDRDQGITYLLKSVELDPSGEWNHRFLGVLYEEAKRYPEALKSLKEAIAVEPTPNAYREMGEVYRLTKEYDAAVESLQQAFKLRPKYVAGYEELAVIYESAEDLDSAIESLRKCLELDPKDQWAYRTLGMIFQDKGSMDKAIENLKKAAELGLTASSYSELGGAYLRKKDYARAIEASQKALEIDRKYIPGYENLEQVYKAERKTDQFIRVMESAVAADPKFVWGHTKLGEAYNNAGRPNDAIASLKRALAVDGKDRLARELLAMIYVEKKDYDLAKETLEASLAVSPTEWAYTELGKVYLLKHDDRAIESVKQALKINSKYEYAYETLESAYAEMKQPQAFLALLEEAIKAQPDFVWAYRKLATAYENAGDYDSAIGSLEKAVELKSDADTYTELAEAYRVKENWANEREIGRKLIELDAKSERGYFYLAEASAGLKGYAQALEAVNKGLDALPRSPLLFAELADIHRLRKEYGPATKACEKAIELSPRYSFPYFLMTRIQLENKDYEKAVASARKAIDAGADAFGLLYDAYRGLNRNTEAVQTFRAYLEKSPENPSILATLGAIYHDLLYLDPSGYEQAYRLYQEAYRLQPKNLVIRENFAEASLTTEHYDEALNLADNVLGDATLTPDQKLSMKMIAIASLLCKKENAAAFSELGEFIRYHESISQDYERGWTFEGTKNFFYKGKILGQPEKTLLLTLIDILESPKDKADKKLAALKGSLPLLFQQFQEGAVSR